jgi:hypothetical protein
MSLGTEDHEVLLKSLKEWIASGLAWVLGHGLVVEGRNATELQLRRVNDSTYPLVSCRFGREIHLEPRTFHKLWLSLFKE